MLPGDQTAEDGNWQNVWQGLAGAGAGLAGSFLGGPLGGAAARKASDYVIDNWGDGGSRNTPDPFAWTGGDSYQGVGLPNTMMPPAGQSSDPFAYRNPMGIGLTNPFQQPVNSGQFLNNTWNAGSGVPAPNFLSGSGYAVQGQQPNQLKTGAMTGYGSRVPNAMNQIGYEQGRQIKQPQPTQMPRSFLGGLVGRDYDLLKGLGR